MRFLATILVACIGATMATADPDRPESRGTLLITVEGAREAVKGTVRAFDASNASRPNGTRRYLLSEARATSDEECPDAAESRSDRMIAVFEETTETTARGTKTASAPAAWDLAYDQLARRGGPGTSLAPLVEEFRSHGLTVLAIEPHLVWIDDALDRENAAAAKEASELDTPDATHVVTALPSDDWPSGSCVSWYLASSELGAGLRKVEANPPDDSTRVTIAHLDTGYPACRDDPGLPPHLSTELSRDFTQLRCDGATCEPTGGAVDGHSGSVPSSHTHGTGTLGILAGGRIKLLYPRVGPYEGPLGGAPFARVVEYRIADFVAVWDATVVDVALGFAADHDVDVVSMSMGGPPTFHLHHAVNHAYCRGVAMFTAAGNNVALPWLPASTPRTTVFPARYSRVVSVVGVTADSRPYSRSPWRWHYLWPPWQVVMRGNVGPARVMDEAIAAYTPNVAWLGLREGSECCAKPRIRLNGAGTSAATPQVAAAAAQWLQVHRGRFDPARWRSWEKSEAAYSALLRSANHETPLDRKEWFGVGAVRAATAIDAGLGDPPVRRPGAGLEWDWIADAILKTIGTPQTLDTDQEQALENMMATEITQLAISSPDLGRVIEESGGDGAIDAAAARRVIRALARDRRASRTLRDYSAKALRSR